MLMIIARCTKGDASEKGLVCVKRDFSAMCDQTVTVKRIVIPSRWNYCLQAET